MIYKRNLVNGITKTIKRSVSNSAPITSQSYINDDEEFLSTINKQEIAKHLANLGPFPSYSNILNAQHFYQNEILMSYAKKSPHPVSLRQLVGFGKTLTKQKILASANFVRLELPIRLSMRIRDLQTLPFGVVNNFHLAQIYESYYHSFNAFRKIPQINTLEQNDKFCETLLALLDDHVFNLSHLMMGALEASILKNLPQDQLDQFMSITLRLRISRRLIVEEHLSLTENYRALPYSSKPADYIGEIFQPCNAVDHFKIVAEKVKDSMLHLAPKELMPDLEMEGDINATFPFMVPHLHYLFNEVLRNSFEATLSTHGHLGKKLPPIKITIVDTSKQVIFRISDQGGGIPHDKLSDIWSFGKSPALARASLSNFHRIPGLQLYSNLKVTKAGSLIVTHSTLDQTSLFDASDKKNHHAQMSTKNKKSTLDNLMTRPHEYKLGLGLAMCKVYADYWNGNLLMNSLEGYGSDTCLTLSKLGVHSNVLQLDRA